MKTNVQKPWLIFGLSLAAISLSERATADVFVNRMLLPPTPEEPCPYTSGMLIVTSAVTWDFTYQNAYGECRQLSPGPPYFFEYPVTVAEGGALNIVEVPIALTQHLDTFAGSTLNLLNADLHLAQPLQVQGIIAARQSSFSGSGLAFTPIYLFNSPSAVFEGCSFDFSDSAVPTGVISAYNVTRSAPLRIDGANFSYSGSTTVLAYLDHRAGPLQLTNSTFAGANGQAVNFFNATEVTFENNTFQDTDCSGTPIGLNCGAPVSFRASLIRSMHGNQGTNNRVNAIVFQLSGSGPAQPSGNWSTTDRFPLVMTGGDLVLDSDQTLNLEAGTVFKFDSGRGIQLRGTLNLLGDPDNPVFLTSLNDSSVGGATIAGRPPPAPGDWGGIQVFGMSAASHASAHFSNCSVRYAGGSSRSPTIGHGQFTNTSITNCSIGQNSGAGIAGTVNRGDAIAVVRSQIQNNGGTGVSLAGYLTTSTVESNTITGNAQGVSVDTIISGAEGDLSLLANEISGNAGPGLMIGLGACPFVVNNIISANGRQGIVKQGSFSCSLQLLNNSIFGNGGDGVRLEGTSAPVPIANNLIWQNVGFGIAEAPFTFSRAVPRFNDVFENGGGIYQRTDGTSLSLDEMNMLPGAGGNISADPLLGMIASGTSASLTFDPASGTSTLTDTNAALPPEGLLGLTINPNTAQERQFRVTANNDTMITVLGDMTTVAAVGDVYLVSQPLAYDPASPLIDAGDVLTHPSLPPTDFGGRARIIDGGSGLIVDIGAHEFDPGGPGAPVPSEWAIPELSPHHGWGRDLDYRPSSRLSSSSGR